MRPAVASLSLAITLAAQARPTAAEVQGLLALQHWHATQMASFPITDLGIWSGGYQSTVLVDVGGRNTQIGQETAAGHTNALLLWPYATTRSQLVERGLLLCTPAGRLLRGSVPADLAAWQPRVECIAAPGVPATVNNMLSGSGEAQDGTRWQQLEIDASRQVVLVTDELGAPVAEARVVIGLPPLGWHPVWLPLPENAARAVGGSTDARGELSGIGIAAPGLWLSVTRQGRIAQLRADDVQAQGDVLLVTAREAAFAQAQALDEQATLAADLRLAVALQRQLRERGAIDRDGDGRGEFGLAFDLLPPAQQAQARPQRDGRVHHSGHLCQVLLPGADGRPVSGLRARDAAVDADGSEQHFAILAWPERAAPRGGRVFYVDERGEVLWTEASGLGGAERAPQPDAALAAGSHGGFGAPLAIDKRGRDGRLWRRLLVD